MVEWGYVIAYYGRQYVDVHKYNGWDYRIEKQLVGHGVVHTSSPFYEKPSLDMVEKLQPKNIEFEYAKIEERLYVKGDK